MNQGIGWQEIRCVNHFDQVATFLWHGRWVCTGCRRELERTNPPTSPDEAPTNPRIRLPVIKAQD